MTYQRGKSKNKKRINNRNEKPVAITCPVCNSATIEVNVPGNIATAFNIEPGHKFVCSGKFIYRYKTDDIQFSKCYGVPVEGAVKMLQIEGVNGNDITTVMKNQGTTSYMGLVMQNDPFFVNVAHYTEFFAIEMKEEKQAEADEDEFDAKAGWDEEDDSNL